MNAASAETEFHQVTSLSHDGRGVAHRGGKTLFIAGALPGERVSVRKLRSRRSYDEAELDQLLTPSPERVTPRCAHFGVCGGCSLQHLEPGAQLRMKQEHLLEELKRIGRVEPGSVLAPLSAPVWGYRRRARLGARYVPRKEKVVVGFRERAAPLVADLRSCEILADPFGRLITPLSELLTKLSIRARMPQVEVAAADDGIAVVLRVLDPPTDGDLELLRAFGAQHRLQIHLQPGGIESVRPLTGSAALHYRLEEFGVEIEFRPTDFIQVNSALNRLMVSQALALLEPATMSYSTCSAASGISRCRSHAAPGASSVSRAILDCWSVLARTHAPTKSPTWSFTSRISRRSTRICPGRGAPMTACCWTHRAPGPVALCPW